MIKLPKFSVPTNPYQVNQLGQFKQLIVGAGSSVFKAQGGWVWGGAANPSSAPFKIYLPTGALTTTGTIDATGGNISGDLTVTGSLLSDDGATYQTKLYQGELQFLKNGSVKAGIKTSSGSNGLTLRSVGSIYFTDLSGNPNAELDANSNLKFSNDAYISWAGGRSLTASGSKITCDGDFEVSGSYRRGTYAGDSGTISGADGKTIRVRGGIITDLNE